VAGDTSSPGTKAKSIEHDGCCLLTRYGSKIIPRDCNQNTPSLKVPVSVCLSVTAEFKPVCLRGQRARFFQ